VQQRAVLFLVALYVSTGAPFTAALFLIAAFFAVVGRVFVAFATANGSWWPGPVAMFHWTPSSFCSHLVGISDIACSIISHLPFWSLNTFRSLPRFVVVLYDQHLVESICDRRSGTDTFTYSHPLRIQHVVSPLAAPCSLKAAGIDASW
jgi:hypothetical protein